LYFHSYIFSLSITVLGLVARAPAVYVPFFKWILCEGIISAVFLRLEIQVFVPSLALLTLLTGVQ